MLLGLFVTSLKDAQSSSIIILLSLEILKDFISLFPHVHVHRGAAAPLPSSNGGHGYQNPPSSWRYLERNNKKGILSFPEGADLSVRHPWAGTRRDVLLRPVKQARDVAASVSAALSAVK